MTRHLFDLSDLGREGLLSTLDLAERLKRERGTSSSRPLAGKSIALVFEKASTRTRLSLEVAVAELGGHPIVITGQGSQIGRGEPIADTARVLARMVHGITFRTSGEERLHELAENATVPVLNALTNESHPMQLLADLMTARAEFGNLDELTFTWLGDGNNMANSWIEAAGLLKLKLRLACPEGFEPMARYVKQAAERGGRVEVLRDPRAAVAGAHVISTDVFASMGQESEAAERLRVFAGYQLTRELLKGADPRAIVLHCLPAHRGEEIAADVLEGPQSRVWDQAEARLHTAKAALLWALGLDA